MRGNLLALGLIALGIIVLTVGLTGRAGAVGQALKG